MIKLGVKVKDKVTGFHGIVAGRSEYLGGNVEYQVQPKCDQNIFPESIWFPEKRLIEDNNNNKKAGF